MKFVIDTSLLTISIRRLCSPKTEMIKRRRVCSASALPEGEEEKLKAGEYEIETVNEVETGKTYTYFKETPHRVVELETCEELLGFIRATEREVCVVPPSLMDKYMIASLKEASGW